MNRQKARPAKEDMLHSYFEGWYFKQQSGQQVAALIPALHADRSGVRSASVQIITNDAAYCADYPYVALRADRDKLVITAGKSIFSPEGIELNLQTGSVTAKGRLCFGALSPLRYDIMGFFRFIPCMECRHSVYSMTHSITGNLTINGTVMDFTGGVGYIEGDCGRSFPKRYAWTQCNWQDERPCSLMLSVADIPVLGGCFTGVICAVRFNGREYRIATYCGAKVTVIERGFIMVRQGRYMISAQRLEATAHMLHAPESGRMTRMIRENPSCHVKYQFAEGNNLLFEFTADNAGFEYEYET